jgi:putative FmdB family regulatory protein
MPIYTYVCEKCGARFEAFASIKKKETGWQPRCPRCDSPHTRQTYESVAVRVGAREPAPPSGCCAPRRG